MNILNTIQKYFKAKSSTEKNEFPLTSANQVLNLDTKLYVDEQINTLKRYCDTLSNFVTPQRYEFQDTTDVSMTSSLINIIVIGKLVVIVGSIYTKSNGQGLSSGYHYFDLPIKLRPIASTTYDGYIRYEGAQHRIQYGVQKNHPERFLFYNADAIGTGQTIPINLVYTLDEYTNYDEA